ncbi:hypothetical protein RHSIM_Rhsim11G0146600 [Rhododendron simsii]|uniref:Uncharacterized protein n=1 Tax=Rhododendron simsii TaxID=118357 RepID=A0A834G7Z4_RHOSS|nr:hypothetical protein RHSIM_Rhsim11G0146600 [Rhododendron simsii]
MEQKPELPTQLTTNNEEERGGLEEEEFYEKIEAPKFVDFTAPDPYRPDDRYWFCLRVALFPEYCLARSVRFDLGQGSQKSLHPTSTNTEQKGPSSADEKCPLSAPPKPSKSRVSRLAVISSFSQKLVDGKGKAKPLCHTENQKAKPHTISPLSSPPFR